jgi:CRISPR-associated Csx2 family protein
MKKIISFLGFNDYKETTYIHPDGSDKCKTRFFQEALVKFYQPDIIYVLLTPTVETQIPKGASKTNWESLQGCLIDKNIDLIPITNIPERNSPQDVWSIFHEVTKHIEKDDTVIFDITHSFRSIPVVALISVSYLRVVHQVNIQGLLYGAFEAENKQTKETPTFDLLPIVDLLEWTTATDQFIKTGNAQALASLLTTSDEPATQELASSVDTIAKGLQLLRPVDVMKEASKLPDRIKAASSNISKTIPPFATLLRRVEQDYGKFGLQNPDDYANNAKITLAKQLKIIEWYSEKGQTIQALSLAREWLPSLLCHHFNLDPLDIANRSDMELLLNGGKTPPDAQGNKKESPRLAEWVNVPVGKKLRNLWKDKFKLANLRNDALHSGFRKNPKSADEIILETRQIIQELQLVAKDWKLEE